MKTSSFPHCCTGKVISGFGQTETADWEIRPHGNKLDKDSIKAEINKAIGYQKHMGKAFISCTTNDQQVEGNKALLELGFQHSAWMSKGAHPETKVRLWWLQLDKVK